MTRGSIRLVRHASTAWTGVRWSGRSDPDLTDEGRREAEALAASLAAEVRPPVVLLSSPSTRAVETASAIGARLDTPVELDPDLREVDLGRVDGLTVEEVTAAFPWIAEVLAAGGGRDIDWPDGERAVDVRARAERAWRRLVGRAVTAEIVAVTHGGVIGALLRVGLPPEGVPAGWSAPASTVRLIEDGSSWRVADVEAPGT